MDVFFLLKTKRFAKNFGVSSQGPTKRMLYIYICLCFFLNVFSKQHMFLFGILNVWLNGLFCTCLVVVCFMDQGED